MVSAQAQDREAIMELSFVFYLFTAFFLISVLHSIRKSERQLINAYSFFALEFFVKILLSSLLAYVFLGKTLHYEESLKVLYVSFLFLFSIWVGFSVRKPSNFLLKHSKIFFIDTKGSRWTLNNLSLFAAVFLLLALLLYVLMMVKGGGGIVWLTNTRYAYQHFREGVGVFYVFAQILMYLAYIIYLYEMKKKTLFKVAILTLSFLSVFYFFGSKRSMVTLILIAIVYSSYNIKRISLIKMFLVFLLLVALFLLSQMLYSNYGILSSLDYFNYFDNMVMLFSKVTDFEFMHGESFLSGLWALVPRGIYPDKPYFFGSSYVTELIYPGMPEKGHFLGVLPWAIYYLDFGYNGVFAGGVVTGIMLQYIQSLFKYNRNIFVFVLFINYAISNILKLVPTMTLFFLVVVFINILRLKVRSS